MIRSKVCIAVIGLSLVACQTSNHSASPTHVAATQRTNLVSQELVQYVNPLMGTDSKFSLSNGNTYPAIATPWAMHFWSPMTAPMGDGWTYKYDDDTLRGIKQTHQPSP